MATQWNRLRLEYGTDYGYTLGQSIVRVWDRLWLHYGTDYG